MFHIEHSTKAAAIFLAAALSFIAANAAENGSPAATSDLYVEIPESHDSSEATRLTNTALQELLLGDHVYAAILLKQALDIEPESALAHAALLATRQLTSAEQQEHFQVIRVQFADEQVQLTPAEEVAIGWLVDIARDNTDEAIAKLQAHNAQFRNDTFSRCWEILLLHYKERGYDILGNASPSQQQAEELAHQLYENNAQRNPLVCYTRALIEEGKPTCTEEALQAAKLAAELMPDHPLPQILCAHLHYRAGEYQEALPYLQRASTAAEAQARAGGVSPEQSEHWLHAQLYEATLLTTLGQENKALDLRRKLNAIPLKPELAQQPDQSLLRWEAHTLPLRILFTPGAPLTRPRIKAAYKAATLPQASDSSASPDVAELHQSRDAMNAALLAIVYGKAGQTRRALAYLKEAEMYTTQLKELNQGLVVLRPQWLRFFVRQVEACTIGINLAKIILYPGEIDTWQTAIRDATQAPSLLLPPVIPPHHTTTSSPKPAQ